MNKFIYIPRNDVVTLASEIVINPLSQIESNVTPVNLNIYFTVDGVLTQVIKLPIVFINKRSCDLVGECLSFSTVVQAVHMCGYPYIDDNGEIVFDLTVDLTKLPLSSNDLVDFYKKHFDTQVGNVILANVRANGKAI